MKSINYLLLVGSFLFLCIASILAASANDDILSLATKFVQEQENTESISNDKWIASEPSDDNFFNVIYSYVGHMTTYIVAGHVGTDNHDSRVSEIRLRVGLQAKGHDSAYPINSMHCYVNWSDGSLSSSYSETVVVYESNSTVYADFGYTKTGGSRVGTGEQVVVCRYTTYDGYTVNAQVASYMTTVDSTSSDDAVKEENTSNIIIKAPTNETSVNSPTSITDYSETTLLKYTTSSFTDEFCLSQSVNVFSSYQKEPNNKKSILSIQLNDFRANSDDRFVASFVNTYLYATVPSGVHNGEIRCFFSTKKGGSSSAYSVQAKLLYTASRIHDRKTFFINPSLLFLGTSYQRQGYDIIITCPDIKIVRAVSKQDVFKYAESATFLVSTIHDDVSDKDIAGQYYCFGSRCSASSIGFFPYLVTLLVFSGIFIFGCIALCWYCCCYRKTIVVPVPVSVNAPQPEYYGAPSYNEDFAPHNNFGPAPGPSGLSGPSYAPAPGPSASHPLLGSDSLRSS